MILLLLAVVIGITTFTDNIDKVWRFWEKRVTNAKPPGLSPITSDRTAEKNSLMSGNKTKGSNVTVKNSPGTVIVSPGRDLNVQGNLTIKTSGQPTKSELRDDFQIERIPVEFKSDRPYPHYAAVRISAREYVHPEVYLKLTADAQLTEQLVFDRNDKDGVTMVLGEAIAINGNILEITQTSSGILPGKPWVVVVFSRQPIYKVSVEVIDESRFSEVSERIKQ